MNMLILVTYDVSTESAKGQKRLRKVAKICTRYGLRVQNSVFECNVDISKFKLLKEELLEIINQKEDSIRFYNLGNKYSNKIEHYGTKAVPDQEDVLII